MKKIVFQRGERHDRGMTLIEVAIALTVFGVILAGGLNLYDRAEQQRRIRVTYEHMDAIVSALSVYAETSGRTPCPGDPSVNDISFGWERGVTAATLQVGAGQFPVGTCDTTNNEGIVPFLSLNLDDATARDGWGHYFTYAVSPQFARSNDQSHNTDGSINATSDVGTVQGRCRSEGWAGRYDAHNISAIKARFCCGDQGDSAANPNYATEPWNANRFNSNTDLIINHTADPAGAAGSLSPARSPVAAGAGQPYDFITTTVLSAATGNTLPSAVANVAPTKILAPAFVLVSHGPNGAGAYLGNGTNNRYDIASASALELINADGDPPGTAAQRRTFVDGPASMAVGANYYDDIVRWMTQDGLMAAHGALSCQYP